MKKITLRSAAKELILEVAPDTTSKQRCDAVFHVMKKEKTVNTKVYPGGTEARNLAVRALAFIRTRGATQ